MGVLNINEVISELGDYKFKRDRYMRSRGSPQMLIIACSTCNTYLMSYQKDGEGPLLRCYLDRIHHPVGLNVLQTKEFNKKSCQKLKCSHCLELIGNPIIYAPENRPAFALKPSSFSILKRLQ